MSTRSAIVLKRNDGKYQGVYCHNDGYPSYNGLMLKNYYKDYDKVLALIELGDLSSLDKNVEPMMPKEGEKPHSFDNRQDGVVTAYHRDLGEEKRKPNVGASINTVVKRIDCEYAYIFDDGQWMCYDIDGDKTGRKIDLDSVEDEYNLNIVNA